MNHCQAAGRCTRTGLFVSLLIALAIVSAPLVYGQGLSGTMTGIVQDQTKALIPNANISLIDQATGAARRTVTNAEGFFSITAIPAGTYNLIVEAQGFARFERTGIVLHPGDKLSFPNTVLSVSTIAEQVKVVAAAEALIPVDTGEKAHTITAAEIQNLAVLGRSADELLKILPGVVFDGEPGTAGFTVQFNSGIGNYHAAGTRNTQIANRSDGTDVVDPGCNCGSAVTPNVDMMQEVKVQTANFSAENAQGPIVFNAVSKSGSNEFHGEGYIYVRRPEFNSQDWRNNRFDNAKPQDSFYFPGFNIGGPLTKGRQKVFFFAGVEIQRQNHDLGVRPAWVPTEAMRNGDFTDTAYLSALNGYDVNLTPLNDQEMAAIGQTWYNEWSGAPLTPEMVANGKVNPAAMDPGGKAMMNLFPLPNTDPSKAGGYNYTSSILNPEHRNQQLARIDWNISDNTKLYTRFNHEYQASPYPYTLWWYNTNDVPWPGKLKGDYTTWSSSTSLVHVFNPTTTNELVVGLTDWRMNHNIRDPKAVSRQGLGYPYKGVFAGKTGYNTDVVPNMTDWGGGVSDFIQAGGLDNPKVIGYKWLINVSDNFSKVIGTHMFKFGAYFATDTNSEPTTNADMGDLQPTNWGGNSTRNAWADLLLGRVGAYDEVTQNVMGNYAKREWSGYAQDSWKVSRRLTLEYGIRLQHPGWMYERSGKTFGFDSRLYDPNVPNSGLVAYNIKNVKDPMTGQTVSVPDTLADGRKVVKSMWANPTLLAAPRFGFAWDVTGKGSTVIRGGGGVFKYNDRNGDAMAIGNPPIQFGTNIGWNPPILSQLDNADPALYPMVPNISALLPLEDKMPTTYSWSFTISKRIPSQTVIEASYVGNSSSHQMACTNCSGWGSINAIRPGVMWGHETETNTAKYRPFPTLGNINVRGHGLSQNYNSLQVTANRQTGRINYQLAYAFSKALGIGGDTYGNESDAFDARGRSYGPLYYDRTHTFSIAYNIYLPGNFHHKLAAGFLNGWQISGISQAQSGAPFNNFSRFNMDGGLADVNPENGDSIPFSSTWVNGTPDVRARPNLICDPRKNLKANQFANAACFVAPHVGQNGVFAMPYIKGPGFQNHDASLFKNFKLSEHKNIQFRWSLYNLLNHPNYFFMGGDNGLRMHFCTINESKDAGNANCSGVAPGTPSKDTLENFGTTTFKRGRRLMQFALKFQF